MYRAMLFYCLKSRKNVESKDAKIVRTKIGRIVLLSKYSVCNSKKSKFLKEERAKSFLSNIGMKTLLSKLPC